MFCCLSAFKICHDLEWKTRICHDLEWKAKMEKWQDA